MAQPPQPPPAGPDPAAGSPGERSRPAGAVPGLWASDWWGPGLNGYAGADARPAAALPWYRRARTWVIAVLLVVVAAAVVTDLPVKQDPATAAVTYMKSLTTYDASCRAALSEAFTLESLVLGGEANATERGEVPGLLRDDLSACSYTNQDLFDMQSNLQPPGTAGGHQLAFVNACVVQWEFPDANEVIQALTRLLGPPTDATAVPALTYWSQRLAMDGSRARAHLASAGAQAKASLPALGLPSPPKIKVPKSTTASYVPPSQPPNPCLKG